ERDVQLLARLERADGDAGELLLLGLDGLELLVARRLLVGAALLVQRDLALVQGLPLRTLHRLLQPLQARAQLVLRNGAIELERGRATGDLELALVEGLAAARPLAGASRPLHGELVAVVERERPDGVRRRGEQHGQ